MQLLILSCNTGEGHNSAAKALKDCFAEQNISCDIMDALAFWSEKSSKLISKGHVFIYRNLPKLFGIGYRFEENHPPKDGEEALMYNLVIRGCDSLYEYLQETDYDAVLCTHVFSSMMMTELKKRHRCDIRSFFIATDYTCSPGVSQTAMDAYFIPHPKLIPEFEANRIPGERLYPYGIPVRKDFYHKVDAEEAKRSLGLPEHKQIVLLMCGSMGCGPIEKLADYLPQQLPSDAMLVVICGSNRKLYRSMTKYPLPDNVKVIGYTTLMPVYMDAASLILTKPGGLSSTEAAVKALPMIFIDAVPGCETRNRDFFVSNGYAAVRSSVLELSDLVCEYLEQPEKLARISEILKKDFSDCAAQKISEHVLKDAECTL